MKVIDMDAGRTMLLNDGVPVLVSLAMRDASSAPARVKAALVIPVMTPEGAGAVPLPFAEAVLAFGGDLPHGWTPEWRLEMN
jgi:hypothetical protein